jgi:hypothetical protein
VLSSLSLPLRHLSFALQGKLNVLLRSLRRLLDESVLEDHLAIAHAEDYPRNPITAEIAPHFPQAMAKRSTIRPSDRPTELNLPNVLAHRATVVGGNSGILSRTGLRPVWLTQNRAGSFLRDQSSDCRTCHF